MKKTVIWNILLVAVLVLQTVAEGLTTAIILRLNMLPTKYVLVLCAGFLLLSAVTAVLLFLRFGRPVGVVRRIIACVLALLIVCGCALLSKLAADAYRTISAVTTVPQTTSVGNMYVLVRMDDPAQTLADTDGYAYAIVNAYDEERTQNAIKMVEDQVTNGVTVNGYETVKLVADALLNQEVDAVILNGSGVALLLEEEAYADFLEKARILHTTPLTELENTEATETTETEAPVEQNVTNTPFVVYVSGSDTRSTLLDVSRSDVNILVIVNPVTKQILLLNTPRDYYIPNPAGNGKLDKLTHCGIFGVDCSIEALEGLYDLKVDYYAQINFTGFETLIDAVGGITFYSDQSFTARDTYIKRGENQLNGAQALDLTRERYHVSGGDNGRGKNQMKVIKALIEKMTSGTTIISNYSQILKSLEGMFTTSLAMDDISQLVKMQLDDMATWNVQTFAVTGKGGHEVTYSWPGETLYVMHPDEDVVAYAQALADRVIAGEIITEEDMTVPEK